MISANGKREGRLRPVAKDGTLTGVYARELQLAANVRGSKSPIPHSQKPPWPPTFPNRPPHNDYCERLTRWRLQIL